MPQLTALVHYFVHVLAVGAVTWFWKERRILKEVLEDGLERRQKETPMLNLSILTELPKDLALLATIVPKIQAAIPVIQKNAADLSQAIADQKNPIAEVADITTLLADLNMDLAILSSILPASTPTPVVPAAPKV